ncbi:DUF1294 domain-containing protein [Faecalicoccus acidiformans]|uniref:DUF1294 domain-containing protein n=1 Tax=Faecalicoccus acidiformans TaxID=915173 RepID=UPI0032082DBC
MTLIWILIFLSLLNIYTFCLFGIDKYKARHHRFRIAENTLLIHAFLGGAMGAWIGMYIFQHKTRRLKFCLLVPMLALFQFFLLYTYSKFSL